MRIAKIAIIITLCLFNSIGFLKYIGWTVGVEESQNLYKIYPSTYIILALCLYKAKYILQIVKSSSFKVNLFVIVATITTIYSLFLNISKGNIYLLNTLVAAGLFYILISNEIPENLKLYNKVLFICFILNGLISIYEKFTLQMLFPSTEEFGIELNKDLGFRSHALMGHPLNNALVMAVLTVYFFLFYKNEKVIKHAILIFGAVSIMCYGARAALVVLIITPFICYFTNFRTLKSLKLFSFNLLKASLYITCIALLANAVIHNTNLGTRILDIGLQFNDESTGERLRLINLLNNIDYQDILFYGLSDEAIELISYSSGINIIENYWILWLVKYGVLTFLILAYSFISFLLVITKHIGADSRIPLLIVFFLISSSNNSLATSTGAVSLFILVLALSKQFHISRYRENNSSMLKSL